MTVRVVTFSLLTLVVLGLALAAVFGHLDGYVPLIGAGVVFLMLTRRWVRLPWDRKPS
ncbi:MAG: hypothetical protein ABI662_12610 [Dermatophilaceae bacterium]